MKIKQLRMKNFKCFDYVSCGFSDGVNIVSGKNASGKTTIADAITWCLFNTDYHGNSNPPVRRMDTDGPAFVELTCTDDYLGHGEMKIRKTQTRTAKGSGYSDSNTYCIDGQKVSKAVFDDWFGLIKFYMLPGAFLNAPVEERRGKMAVLEGVGTVDAMSGPIKKLKLKELEAELKAKNVSRIVSEQKAIISLAKKEIAEINGKIKAYEEIIEKRAEIPASELELKRAALKDRLMIVSSPCSFCGAETSPEAKALTEELAETERRLEECVGMSDEEAALEEYKKDLRDISQMQADAEKILYQLDLLEAAQNEELEKLINEHFSLVEWKLSETAKNGETKNSCIATYQGRNIMDASTNKAARIACMMEICQVLGKGEYPIILDDAESLDKESMEKILSSVDTQVILLKVTNEKELHIKKS